jgi:hypothetical protein
MTNALISAALLARGRTNIFEFVEQLRNGEPAAWIALAAIAGCIAFFIMYEKVTGEPFVKSRAERRAARRRRKHVIWEYHRHR